MYSCIFSLLHAFNIAVAFLSESLQEHAWILQQLAGAPPRQKYPGSGLSYTKSVTIKLIDT